VSDPRETGLPPLGEAAYFPGFLDEAEAWALFRELAEGYDLSPRTITLADGTAWREAIGKLMFVEPRLVDPAVFPEEHGRRVAWPASVEQLMRRVAAEAGTEYQVCVGIHYPDGGVAMGYHADPAAFGDTDSIASVSLGAERCFAIRSRAEPSREWRLRLGHGSLFLMGAGFQAAYEHALLPEPECEAPRINLTFRRFGWAPGGARADSAATRGAGGEGAGFRDPVTARIATILADIGLTVRRVTLPEPTFLPGILIEEGALLVDEDALSHPGDLLHEAGHLAVAEPGVRSTIGGKIQPDPGQQGGEEMAAIAWSYAAAVHLDIDPTVVFHPAGYRGGAASLLENFTNGRYVGVPLLQWMDMTAEGEAAERLGVEPYPHMLRWLRGAPGEPPA
jgi:alkylated DNA repair dioxygenase AlkB